MVIVIGHTLHYCTARKSRDSRSDIYKDLNFSTVSYVPQIKHIYIAEFTIIYFYGKLIYCIYLKIFLKNCHIATQVVSLNLYTNTWSRKCYDGNFFVNRHDGI